MCYLFRAAAGTRSGISTRRSPSNDYRPSNAEWIARSKVASDRAVQAPVVLGVGVACGVGLIVCVFRIGRPRLVVLRLVY